jgi:hypothetical protein
VQRAAKSEGGITMKVGKKTFLFFPELFKKRGEFPLSRGLLYWYANAENGTWITVDVRTKPRRPLVGLTWETEEVRKAIPRPVTQRHFYLGFYYFHFDVMWNTLIWEEWANEFDMRLQPENQNLWPDLREMSR